MLPTKDYYSIFPSVVPANQKTEITIAAMERALMFSEEYEYVISVYDINTDVKNYLAHKTERRFPVLAKDGVIKFEYEFFDEQEHLLILEKNGEVLERFNVYSLYEDLYKLRPMKGDFHSHSYRSDGLRDPVSLFGYYREQGYDCFALTDHNRFYPGGEIDEAFLGVRTGIIRVPGEEVHTPPSPVHIVRIGGRNSVCDKYFRTPEKYNEEIEEYLNRVPSEIPEIYREKFARAMWATDKIHEEDGIAILAHPYWRPGNLEYNICEELATILLKSGMFDAYELVGGMGQIGVNHSINLWNELRAEGLKIPVVGSSDAHSITQSTYFPFYYTICFAENDSINSVVDAIKNGRCVAVEANGSDEYNRQFRVYGPLRYVSYAQYLLTYFFPAFQRLCEGEGVAMRAYAMGDAPKELIEMQGDLCERFRGRFFGKLPPLLPTEEILAFENKWRKTQLDGPLTKGSSLNISNGVITRKI